MADEHLRYERLAVGHVVGGLDDVDAARFRTHLVQCRDCRSRVAELRGIADDLTATEREERAARATTGTTEVEAREETEAPPRAAAVAPVRSWPWRVVLIGLVPLLVLGAFAWAVWMRAEVDLTAAALRTSSDALRIIADGQQLPLDLDDSSATALTGIVAATSDDVVVDLAGLPTVDPDQLVRAALVDADDQTVVAGMPWPSSRLTDGWMIDVLSRDGSDAVAVVVRIEQLAGLQGGEPTVVLELARAVLPLARTTAPVVGAGSSTP